MSLQAPITQIILGELISWQLRNFAVAAPKFTYDFSSRILFVSFLPGVYMLQTLFLTKKWFPKVQVFTGWAVSWGL